MIAIWRGKGPWAVFFPCLTISAAALLATCFAPGKTSEGQNIYLSKHDWPLAAAFLAAGAGCLTLGLMGNRGPGVRMIERETGREIVVRVRHSLYRIPVEFWSVPYFLLGFYFLLRK